MNIKTLFLILAGCFAAATGFAQDEAPKLTKKQQKMVDKWEASMAEEEAYKQTQRKADSLFRVQDYAGAISQYEKIQGMRPDEAPYFQAKIQDIRIIIQREEARKAALAKAQLESEKRPETPALPTVPEVPQTEVQPAETPIAVSEPAPKPMPAKLPVAVPEPPTPKPAPKAPKADPPPNVIAQTAVVKTDKPETKPAPEPKKPDPKEEAIQERIAQDVAAAKNTAKKEMEEEKKAQVVKATQPKAVKSAEEVVDAEGNPYPEGMTEEIIEKTNVIIIKRVIVKGREIDVYQKATHKWGGVYFFKNDQGISERIWIADTGKP